MELRNKTILILSQQDWGGMYISKHHYAIELGKRGNTVYYINGPDQRNILSKGEIRVEETGHEGVYLLRHRVPFPYVLRFKAKWLYYQLIKKHIKNIEKKTEREVDIVWSFDLSNTIPLKDFSKKALKIYMPVDESGHVNAIDAGEEADIIFSVTEEIIAKYGRYNVPKYFINHGVSEVFINNNIEAEKGGALRITISGNLLRPDIDYGTLLQIVKAHSDITFDFWGGYDNKTSNLASGTDTIALDFIKQLQALPNAVLHGQADTETLAKGLKEANGALICYDIVKDQSKGTNYHKILEYLGAGNVVVSNNVSTYEKYPGLLEMTTERNSNKELPGLFAKVVDGIKEYNSIGKKQERVAFAKEHTYSSQVDRIEELLQNISVGKA